MKILFVAPRFHTNQIGWVRALKEAGNEVAFHVLLKGPTENYSDIDPTVLAPSGISMRLMRLLGSGGENHYRGFPGPLSYARYLRALRPDVLIVRDIGRWFSFLAATLGRIQGAKIVIYSQTPLYKQYSLARRGVTWWILMTFKACWMTPISGNRQVNILPPSNMFYVPFSIPVNQRRRKDRQGPLCILSIGKFEARKNYQLLLAALKRVRESGVDFHLTIIGEMSKPHHFEEYRRVFNKVVDLKLDARVKILVNVDHREIYRHYADADVFVLPATAEPASISVLEALGSGLPVVCSSTCGTRWYVDDGETGMTFIDNSLEDLIRVMKRMLDADVLAHMKATCMDRTQQRMSSAAFLSAFNKMLESRFP